MSIPLPSDVSELSSLSAALDGASHAERLAWAYTLDEAQQLRLFDLAKGTELDVSQVVHQDESVFIHSGKNGLPIFNRFEKRFARLGSEIVGYNHNESLGGPFNPIVSWFVGPGHYTAYDSPDGDGIWVDYRQIPSAQHPAFPPLIDNDHGVRGLIFGNMVDVIRRVSDQVLIGNAFKNKSPARTMITRLGSKFPTAPFILVQPQ